MTQGVIYARVSSEEQKKTGYSVGAQLRGVEGRFAELGIVAARTFEEVHSAKAEGRPVFDQMVRFLLDHPEVRVVGVDKQDRLSRNLIDFGVIRDRLGCRVVSVKDPTEQTPEGHFMQDLTLAFSAQYSRNLSREVRKGARAKFEAGGLNGRAVVGYRNVTRTRTAKARVEADPERAPLVRHFFERYATGVVSLRDLSNEMFDLGLRTAAGKPFSPERMRKLLSHPFYRGLVRYEGATRPGTHETIIAPGLAAEVDRVLARRSGEVLEKGKKFFLLRGLLYCGGCGRFMTGEAHPCGTYYRCLPDAAGRRCGAPYVPAGPLEAQVEALLPRVALAEAGKAEILTALDRLGAEHEALRDREQDGLAQRRRNLDAKLARLTDGFAAGDIPKESFRQVSSGYQAELRTVDARLAFLATDPCDDVDALRALLDTASCVARLYDLAPTPAEKKDHLRRIFSRIEVSGRAVSAVEYRPPFHLLLGDPAARAGSKVSPERALLDHLAERRAPPSAA